MTNLEKVKILIELSKIGEAVKPEASAATIMLYNKFMREMKNQLKVESLSETTPKDLYGKAYSELAKEELAEYTQIKRLIKRAKV